MKTWKQSEYMFRNLHKYISTKSFYDGQDVTQSQFLSRIQLGWIEFSFTETDCSTKVEEPNLLYHLSIVGERWVHAFLKSIIPKWNVNSHIQHLNLTHHVYFQRKSPLYKTFAQLYNISSWKNPNKSLFNCKDDHNWFVYIAIKEVAWFNGWWSLLGDHILMNMILTGSPIILISCHS